MENPAWAAYRERARKLPPIVEIPVLTRETALKLTRNSVICHNTIRNADKTCARARINGIAKTWVTDPSRFEIPWKRGLYEHGYLTNDNVNQWHVSGSCPSCAKHQPGGLTNEHG